MKPHLNRLAIMAVASIGFASSIRGATITFTNINAPGSETNTITNSSGTLLNTPSSIVGVGYFSTLLDSQLSALNGATFSQVATDFQLFGTSTVISDPFSIAGTYQYDSSAAVGGGSPFIGKYIYTLIGNASTFAGSSEFLIYKQDTLFGQDPGGNATTNLSRANEMASLVDQTKLLWGGYDNSSHDIGDGFGLTPSYNTLGVPEPSRSVLVLFGLCGLVLRRRRK